MWYNPSTSCMWPTPARCKSITNDFHDVPGSNGITFLIWFIARVFSFCVPVQGHHIKQLRSVNVTKWVLSDRLITARSIGHFCNSPSAGDILWKFSAPRMSHIPKQGHGPWSQKNLVALSRFSLPDGYHIRSPFATLLTISQASNHTGFEGL